MILLFAVSSFLLLSKFSAADSTSFFDNIFKRKRYDPSDNLGRMGADNRRTGSSIKLPQTNFLMIMFDDLRPELNFYGKHHIISPNFDRLAERSVIFDNAYCQVAVCNPSRDSLLTGLRPDTTGTYGFQSDWRPHLILPTRLKRSGYYTAGFGKILHWDEMDKEVWDHHYELFGGWYQYQNYEWDHMNSSVMPDKYRSEESFPDYVIASEAISGLRNLSTRGDYFMLAVGFKMPHLSMHVPYKYFDMYRKQKHLWQADTAKLTFPPTAPIMSYRCCADRSFKYMNNEGALPSAESSDLESIDKPIPERMHMELMWGYASMITFVDRQLGRLLDAVDELQLWNNLTIVLTSDHGMHNGEKGLWEKWSLFDESTHVPLLIHHPLSPYKGQHYKEPVELIDIVPTLHEILGAPFSRKDVYIGPSDASFIRKMVPLQGKSLARTILGGNFRYNYRQGPRLISRPPGAISGRNQSFALSQALKCADISLAKKDPRRDRELSMNTKIWIDCDVDNKNYTHIVAAMGYSMRTLEFRYTAWVPFRRPHMLPLWRMPLLAEELYDHRDDGESASSLGSSELVNLANDKAHKETLMRYRDRLMNYLRRDARRLYKNLTRVHDK